MRTVTDAATMKTSDVGPEGPVDLGVFAPIKLLCLKCRRSWSLVGGLGGIGA